MREIKFRGLNKNNEFVYGDLYSDIPNSTCYYKEYSQRICWFPESGGQANQPVKNETVGEFTGLTDKNGVEIYEGDKLRSVDPYNGEDIAVVRWDNKYARFVFDMYYDGDSEVCESCGIDEWTSIDHFEVIGNIYQTEEA